jgi:hypothetical protein
MIVSIHENVVENTEVAIKNSKSRVTGKIGHKTQNEDKENKKLKIDQLKRCETRTSPKN